MKQKSLFIQSDGHQLHLRNITKSAIGIPILMLHGAIENGLIFYTKNGKGLACYLAEQGFDVYVADLRGRGESTPSINANSNFGQSEVITQDIPLLLDYITDKTNKAMHVISHSWGGVLMASCLVRYPQRLSQVATNTCFGTKRRVTVKSIEKYIKVNLLWNNLAPKLANKRGFLDAKKYGFGSDNETKKSLEHSITWVKKGGWIDPYDGFDYNKAAKNMLWPPTWHFTGIKDRVLGHAQDVRGFIEESYNHQAKFTLLSKNNGNALDYDHINILTHPRAVTDHFPLLAKWLGSHS
jgi:pimeloyl-ACP methyl ester carboxylesterase